MSILITGAGLVGSFAAKMLREQGHDVVLFELAPNREGIASVLGSVDVPLVQGDIADIGLVVRTLRDRKVTKVIHTAGLLTAGAHAAPVRAVHVNVGGTTALLDAARTAGVERFVFCSTVLTFYGMLSKATVPVPGDFAMHVVSERPPSIYAATKLACEHIGAVLCSMAGMEFTSLRFAALFGPWRGPVGGVTGHVFRTILEQAVRDRRVTVRDPQLIWQGSEDFTYVKDAASSVVKAAISPQPVSGAHNISMGQLYSFEDMLARLKDVVPGLSVAVEAKAEGIAGFKYSRSVPADVSSAEQFGWAPEYQMREALADYVGWLGHDAKEKAR